MTTAPIRKPVAFAYVDDIVAALRAAGHRVSQPARVVLDAMFMADGPVSAERVAMGLDGRLQKLDLASVYRNLERLEKLGVVSHVHVGHGPGLYALVRGDDPEYLVCQRCDAVTTVQHAALAPVRDAIRDAFGYRADFSHFPIHGLCADCARVDPSHTHEHGGQMSHAPDDHSHDAAHGHEHSHGDVTHSHPHTDHDHDHVEHEHEHAHDDVVHSHPHVHEDGLEHEHAHPHE